MNARNRQYAVPFVLVVVAGCATQAKPPPVISLDEPVEARLVPDPPQLPDMPASPSSPDATKATEIVAVPEPLPLSEQLKRWSEPPAVESPEPVDDKVRVSRANAQARVAPSREGFVNAIQVWPYSDGALYQVYTSPGRVTVIALQEGEELATVSAGDTVRWIVGDTTSGSGTAARVNVLVKPTRVGLKTNLVITTDRRMYLLELSSTPQAWMASVSWDYPKDRLLALQKQARDKQAAAPIESGLSIEQIRFRYAITGDSPPWKPLRAFDDGKRVYIQFPGGIAQGELPPLFVIGPQGDGQLVNYRFRSPYYIVDRLFGAAELRLGAAKAQVVRIERTDAVAAPVRGNGS